MPQTIRHGRSRNALAQHAAGVAVPQAVQAAPDSHLSHYLTHPRAHLFGPVAFASRRAKNLTVPSVFRSVQFTVAILLDFPVFEHFKRVGGNLDSRAVCRSWCP
jgi:hypothetical protein